MSNPNDELEITRLIEELSPPFFGLLCNCIPYTKDKIRIYSNWKNDGNGHIEEIRTPDEETHYITLVEVAQSNYLKHLLLTEEYEGKELFLKHDVEAFGANKDYGKFILLENIADT